MLHVTVVFCRCYWQNACLLCVRHCERQERKKLPQSNRCQTMETATKNGKPLVELVPHRPPPKRSPLGVWKGKVLIKGDIISPIDVEWDALK